MVPSAELLLGQMFFKPFAPVRRLVLGYLHVKRINQTSHAELAVTFLCHVALQHWQPSVGCPKEHILDQSSLCV